MVWKSSEDAAFYRLQVDTSSAFNSTVIDENGITDTTKALITLNNNTTYYWRLNATNVEGTSEWSNTWHFTTRGTGITPPKPVAVFPGNGTGSIPTNPTLKWHPANAANSYGVQVSASQDFATTVFNESGISDTLKTIQGLQNATTYYWSVNATNENGTSDWSNTWSFTTVLNAPTLVSPPNYTTDFSIGPTLIWDSSSERSVYQLQIATSSDFTALWAEFKEISQASQPISNLETGTIYYWRVRAIILGDKSEWSET
ncbi:fibronectin type III domain-containing protein [candidate division KSB1 bacterium]|nr:fibronectin type III domain-containing protein [candidate division KSB1 bacterium]